MAKVSKSKASAAELLEALDELQSEKGITKEYMVESLKLALEAAYRKNYETEENVKVLGEVEDMRSTIKETCPECGHDEAYYELKQTRSADEAPTRIFTCAKCKHTWRAYH